MPFEDYAGAMIGPTWKTSARQYGVIVRSYGRPDAYLDPLGEVDLAAMPSSSAFLLTDKPVPDPAHLLATRRLEWT